MTNCLASTGADVVLPVVIGLLIVVIGVAAVIVMRRWGVKRGSALGLVLALVLGSALVGLGGAPSAQAACDASAAVAVSTATATPTESAVPTATATPVPTATTEPTDPTPTPSPTDAPGSYTKDIFFYLRAPTDGDHVWTYQIVPGPGTYDWSCASPITAPTGTMNPGEHKDVQVFYQIDNSIGNHCYTSPSTGLWDVELSYPGYNEYFRVTFDKTAGSDPTLTCGSPYQDEDCSTWSYDQVTIAWKGNPLSPSSTDAVPTLVPTATPEG